MNNNFKLTNRTLNATLILKKMFTFSIYRKAVHIMSEEKFTYEDAMKMLYSPEAIKAAGGVENHRKAIKKWKRRDRWVYIKTRLEVLCVPLLAILLIIGIVIVVTKII